MLVLHHFHLLDHKTPRKNTHIATPWQPPVLILDLFKGLLGQKLNVNGSSDHLFLENVVEFISDFLKLCTDLPDFLRRNL